MRKAVIFLTIFSAVILFAASCATHEHCPAYGKANTLNHHNKSI